MRLLASQRAAFEVTGLAAHKNAKRIVAQAQEFGVSTIALSDPAAAADARSLCPSLRIFAGENAQVELLQNVPFDLCIHGVTGAAGLPTSAECLRLGRTLALANKESLVIAGDFLTALARKSGATIVPVDSEHSAIFQCVRREPTAAIRRIYLTASGGPFLDRDPGTFGSITREEALKHPNWQMGERITIGSATMMNKAFEVIEAHHLFGLTSSQIRVLVHRQSIIHSMVEFLDGSMLAQLGVPDMRVPIQVALHHPDRGFFAFEPFDPVKFSKLTFSEIEPRRFPALALGYRALEAGGTAGAVLNAADEVATQRFLRSEIAFTQIAEICENALDHFSTHAIHSLEDVYAIDRKVREFARAAAPVRVPVSRRS